MSNKKIFTKNTAELWNLKVRKRPNDLKDIEFDIEMSVVSINIQNLDHIIYLFVFIDSFNDNIQ